MSARFRPPVRNLLPVGSSPGQSVGSTSGWRAAGGSPAPHRPPCGATPGRSSPPPSPDPLRSERTPSWCRLAAAGTWEEQRAGLDQDLDQDRWWLSQDQLGTGSGSYWMRSDSLWAEAGELLDDGSLHLVQQHLRSRGQRSARQFQLPEKKTTGGLTVWKLSISCRPCWNWFRQLCGAGNRKSHTGNRPN